jgi:hypothetical protein
MNVALNTAYYTVKAAGWWIPAFITAGIVLVALAVVTAVIVLNWDVIRPVFNNIVNQFLSIAGKVASWVRDFFNGALGNAQAALTQVIGGVKYVIDVVLTIETVAQMQKSGYYFLVLRSKDNKMYFNPSWVTQKIAIEALKLNLKSIGTYTLIDFDARNIAGQASLYGDTYKAEVHNKDKPGLYFEHYHPKMSNRDDSHAHSWFGAPIWV